MAGVTSGIAIASNALILLGHTSIASFDEGTAGAVIADNLYETSYLSLLSNHRWRFATKTVELAKLVETPDNGFSYAYQLPGDLLYLQKTTARTYEIYGSKLYTNDNTITADYTYRVDEDKLPPYFTKMFEFFLASQFAVPLTGDMDKGSYYGKFYLNELKRAKYADSTQTPPNTVVESPYVEVRYNGMA
jgi:hypothetical protein